MLPEYITCDWLKENGACKESIKIFNKLFPDGAEVTLDNLIKARKLGLNLSWLAKCLGFGSWHYNAYDLKCATRLWACICKEKQ